MGDYTIYTKICPTWYTMEYAPLILLYNNLKISMPNRPTWVELFVYETADTYIKYYTNRELEKDSNSNSNSTNNTTTETFTM